MHTLSQDIRYSLRLLIKNPAFTSLAVLILVLGIVATTVIFTLVDAALLRPLPYSDPSRLVAVFDSRTQVVASRFESSHPDFLDWREQNTAFSSLAGYVPSDSVARFSGVPELVPTGAVCVTNDLVALSTIEPKTMRTSTQCSTPAGVFVAAFLL